MADTISQDDINALFESAGGEDNAQANEDNTAEAVDKNMLNEEEKDVIGEIGNISMGSAATALSQILNEKVVITTPKIKEKDFLVELLNSEEKMVSVDIKYKSGLDGTNLLLLKEQDVKLIAGKMMGAAEPDNEPLTEMELSAVSEAMNQMIGAVCTSMSQVFNQTVDITPPVSEKVDPNQKGSIASIDMENDTIVVVDFELLIGDNIKSQMMQIMPINVAKQLIEKMMPAKEEEKPEEIAKEVVVDEPPTDILVEEEEPAVGKSGPVMQGMAPPVKEDTSHKEKTASDNVQKVEFTELEGKRSAEKEKIALIQDVPLEVVVELGRTHKSVKEILEFGPGVVIELDKMAGEPIDILINDKFIAKGEVVVIDENFGIRITEIIDVKKRI